MSTRPPNRPTPQPIDPLLQQRLQALGQRRPSGAPLPPPSGAAATATTAATPTVRTPGRKVKPARASKVASVAISAATTLFLAGIFARQDSSTTDSVVLTSGTDPAATAATTATTVAGVAVESTTAAADTTAATTAATTATTVAAAPATIADGTYLGVADQNRWGVVQVQVVYSGGQINDVQILAYPDADRKSVQINQRALPTLISAAISANSASVDNVSGATYTSDSYIVSLQSAIDAAKQASGVTG